MTPQHHSRRFQSLLPALLGLLLSCRAAAFSAGRRAVRDDPYPQKIGRGLDSVITATLADKARHFEEIIRDRHVRDGFIRELTLTVPGDPSQGGALLHNDNDGLWTGLYVAAMSFKFAATGDPEAREWAGESFRALERLESVTGIPGFPARSMVPAGEPERLGYDGEWRRDASGAWEWKGDTSSDEVAGHFFAYSVFYDLAADEADKARVRKAAASIMDHIMERGWTLAGADGKPTRWGVWSPDQLNSNRPLHGLPDEDWREERGLNSLLILSHLQVACHVTGDPKYRRAYLELIEGHGYAENTVELKISSRPDAVNHSDDELAFCGYYPLLTYETDPDLRSIYLKSLRRTWEIERPERNPWWNFTACAFLDGDCGLDDSVRTLRELHWDQVNWGRDNRGLAGVRADPEDPAQSLEVPPYERISIQRWNADPYSLVSGENGEKEGDGVLFLLPYWMGRLHGFIR